MKSPILVVDIGGTCTRFARARQFRLLEPIHTVRNNDFRDIFDLFSAIKQQFSPWKPSACVLAVAGPIDSDHVLLTNLPWSFSQRKLRQEFKFARMLVVNDFVAVANCLPLLKPKDLFDVGGGHGDPRRAALVCGPGTGFGAAVLLKGKNRVQALASESGHMRLGPADEDEDKLINAIRGEARTVIVEHLLSGSGLERLHRLRTDKELNAEEIVSAAHDGNRDARATIDFFLKIFGRIAGDLALAFDARGGVFIAGGVGRSLGPFVPNSQFRATFEYHPPYQPRLRAIPTKVIAHPYPGLLGAARLAKELPPRS